MPGPWVLVTDGGSGQSRDCIAAVRALVDGGYRPAVTVSGRTSKLGSSRYCARMIAVPPVADSRYVAAIEAERQRDDYLTTVAASEASLLALAPGHETLTDKVMLAERAAGVGLDVPRSRVFSSPEVLKAEAETVAYPVVVKPAIRTFNAFRAESPSDLRRLPRHAGEVIVQPFLQGGRGAVCGVISKGDLIGAVHERWLRTWPLECGLASAAETVEPDNEVEERLCELLRGYEGIFCAQFIDDRLIDLNLRVYSTHSLAMKAGVNLVAMSCDLMRDMPVARTRAKPGHFYRWLEGDVRNVVRQARSGSLSPSRAVRALVPRRQAAHSIESLRDPGPFLARLSYAMGRVHMPEEARRAEG